MGTMFSRVKVQDFAAWKAIYDEMAPARKRHGISDVAIYRDLGDRDRVTVLMDFEDGDEAALYAESDELRDAMRRAGVVGQPDMWLASG